jgi:sulfite reductase (NADPH) flavoprotein alpha-component
MDRLLFSVLALGDEHYEHFCACGRNVDNMLEKLGGKRWMPRTDMGSDFRREIHNLEAAIWRHFDKIERK